MKETLELRWDPVLGEWVMVSNIRHFRPWHPRDFCPFCPGAPETGYGWKALILENKFPTLSPNPPPSTKHYFYRTAKAYGRCYVVVETPQHDLDDLSDLSVEDIEYVLNMIIDKQVEVSRAEFATYFLWFRNKGSEIGVSLTHPHSQIYVTPFIPSKILNEIRSARSFWTRKGQCLFCLILDAEVKDRVRIIYSSDEWVGFIPFYAHWPFEVHLYPRRHVQLLTQLTKTEVNELAIALKTILCGLKIMFTKPMPYIMVVHQAPLKGYYSFYHLHIEVYGMLRDDGKLKYAGGIETGGGNFTYDSTPEENARKLREKIDECCRKHVMSRVYDGSKSYSDQR